MSQSPLSEKQHKKLYAEIEAMSEKELDEYLKGIQSKFDCDEFRKKLNRMINNNH